MAVCIPPPEPEVQTCEHSFTFLRQDERNDGYDRNPLWIVEDVYFCSKCLEYRRVDVMKRTPKNDGGNYMTRLR